MGGIFVPLKIEEGTPFYEMREKLPLPDEDSVCDMYLRMCEAFEKAGIRCSIIGHAKRI